MAPGPEHAPNALVGARASNAGWSRVRMEPPHGPQPLLDAALAVADDDLFIFGGRTANGALSPELWHLEHAAGAWSTVQAGGGARPAARTGHSLVALRGSVWLLGGRGASEELLGAQERIAHRAAASSTRLQPLIRGAVTSITPQLCPTLTPPRAQELIWQLRLPSAGAHWVLRPPSTPDAAMLARADHCAAAYDNLDTMLVHGGRGQAGLLEDLWSWDNLRSQWEQLDGAHSEGPAGGVRPVARRGHACALLGATRQLMVLGGRSAPAPKPASAPASAPACALASVLHPSPPPHPGNAAGPLHGIYTCMLALHTR